MYLFRIGIKTKIVISTYLCRNKKYYIYIYIYIYIYKQFIQYLKIMS